MDVFTTAELGMKADSQLQQCTDRTPHPRFSGGRTGSPTEDLEQCALSGAIIPDDSERRSPGELETDILESSELRKASSRAQQQATPGLPIRKQGIAFVEPPDVNRYIAHNVEP